MEFEEYTQEKTTEDNLTYFTRKVFSTEDGKRMLEELKKHFIEEPVAVPGYDISYAHFREGQNDIVRQFIKATEIKA
jgi:hypothetical protein